MLESFTFWLIVLAVLVAYLCVSIGLRLRTEAARRRARERLFPGTAFDVSAIAPQIQRVRQKHVGAVPCGAHHAFYRAGLIAAARRLVASLSYFRRAEAQHEIEKHEA